MCGIAGVFEREGRADLGRLTAMSRLMRHRGPDGEGIVLLDKASGHARVIGGPDTPAAVYASGLPWAPGHDAPAPREARHEIGLLQRRLAIVDLSPTGHQPMCDHDRGLWIVFNGEVYNWVELRRELEGLGERFVSRCDTEVILAAYRRWGADCLSRFNGMFAFALWDTRARRLFCARDRFGVKPFYYSHAGGRFAFASEPKALVLTQPLRIRARDRAVRDLLALDWVDHERETFFEGVYQLPAAHWLMVGDAGLEVNRWWTLDPARRVSGDPASYTHEFAELFTDAVRLRLRADVPVGSCLSGGLDSTSVVTTMARLGAAEQHTFTCAYDLRGFDEREHVDAAVAASGARAHRVMPDGADLWRVFDALAYQQDEPTAGSGLFSQWKVMELAHAHGLKVLLDGQGGDETLAGYFRYLPIALRDRLLRGDVAGFARHLGGVASRLGTATTLALVLEPWVPRSLFAPLRRRFGQGKDRVLAAPLRALRGAPPRPPREFRSGLANQLAFDTLQRLLPSLLRYEDRNSMAFSIETRLPFLDYRLVEFVFALPDEQRLDGTTTKAILRRALADRVPAGVLARRDKMGFETPTDLWLRTRHGIEAKRRLSRPGPIDQWLDRDAMSGELEGFLAGRRAIGLQVWRWLALDAWSRRYLERDVRVLVPDTDEAEQAGGHRDYLDVVTAFARGDGATGGTAWT
jgi:asparagine synthase (glutamine-hydrolysing)